MPGKNLDLWSFTNEGRQIAQILITCYGLAHQFSIPRGETMVLYNQCPEGEALVSATIMPNTFIGYTPLQVGKYIIDENGFKQEKGPFANPHGLARAVKGMIYSRTGRRNLNF
jgi:hypothetical protein